MTFTSHVNPASAEFKANRESMLEFVDKMRSLGQRAVNRSKYAVTVATVVCWSMISDSHTR